MSSFWEQFCAGFLHASGGEAHQPFGLWPLPPLPPLPQPKRPDDGSQHGDAEPSDNEENSQ